MSSPNVLIIIIEDNDYSDMVIEVIRNITENLKSLDDGTAIFKKICCTCKSSDSKGFLDKVTITFTSPEISSLEEDIPQDYSPVIMLWPWLTDIICAIGKIGQSQVLLNLQIKNNEVITEFGTHPNC